MSPAAASQHLTQRNGCRPVKKRGYHLTQPVRASGGRGCFFVVLASGLSGYRELGLDCIFSGDPEFRWVRLLIF